MEQQLPGGFGTLPSSQRFLLLGGIALSAFQLNAVPLITDVSITQTQVIVTFEESGPNNQFQIQRNPDLDPNNWSTDLSASISPPVNGVRTYTLSRGAADKEFFQIIGSFLGTGPDPDGDGLPTTFETEVLGTDGTKFDSDGDTFNDGFEFAAGTDPNDINDFPPNSLLPRISFSEASITATEGDGVVSLNLETDSGSPGYTGPVNFSVISVSTAVSGTDYTLGSASFSGNSGSLPLTLIDNGNLSPEFRVLSLQIDDSPGQYLRGGAFDTTIIIADNDVYWSGVLRDGFCEESFRLRLIINNGTPQFAFVAGVGNDGLPVPENNVASDQTAGIVPAGIHLATVNVFTASQVEITSPAMPVAQSPLFGGGATLERILSLNAIDSSANAVITGQAVGGVYSETVADPTGANPHLTISKSGTFAIVKQTPLPPALPTLYDSSN